MLIVNLFGSFDVRSRPDRPIALRSKKAQALLAYLCAHLGQPQLRDKLSALLWPDVILEDVHWADEMTLRLLAFLARRLGSRSVLLVATARQEEVESASILGRLLEELVHDRSLVRVELMPLSREATTTLVRGLARAGSDRHGLSRTAEHVWALSEGNPFVIVECMRAVLDSTAESGAATLPQRVREVITARLQLLGDRARSLLNVAAVVAREFSFALAQRAAGLDAADAAAGIEELVRLRVLDASGEELEFAHDRIRRVVYESLLAPTRRALHGAVGGALESLYGDAADAVLDQLAHHYTHADDAGKAIAYLAKLAESTRQRHALTDAVRLLDQALGFVDRLPVPERDVRRVQLLLAKARWPIGLAMRARARIAAAAGDLAEAEHWLNEALAIFADLPAPLERAHTHVLAAEMAARRADAETVDRHLRDALRLYRELDVPRRHADVEQRAHRLRPVLAPATTGR